MDQEDHHFIKSLEQQWTCSISKMIMKDPVVTADGHTYDRESITKWFENENKSPNTGLELLSQNIVPNIAFKNLMERLNAELPGFLAREEGLKTYGDQLKEEIDYLKVELHHEKEKNDEHIDRQEREFKTKRIEKTRHEDKNVQLKVIRDQKNVFQKQLQQLRTKEQQQSRQIRLLKEELTNFQQLYTEASKSRKEFQESYINVSDNRREIMNRLRGSFSSNLNFIGHLLQSIEDTKKFEAQLVQKEKAQKEKGSQATIAAQNIEENPQGNPQIQANQANTAIAHSSGGIMKKLEQIIRGKVNGEESKQQEDNQEQFLGGPNDIRAMHDRRVRIRRLIIERRRNREREQGQQGNIFRNHIHRHRDDQNQGGRHIGLFMRPNRIPNRLQFVQPQPLQIQQTLPQPQPQPQQTQPQLPQVQPQLQNQPQPQNQPQSQPLSDDQMLNIFGRGRDENWNSQLYKQLQSIKWMMSKRNYNHLPHFYGYDFMQQNDDRRVFWFGVRIRVLQSRIPFAEYLQHSWSHVRILDLSACNIDDELWQKFIGSSSNFRGLTFINLNRNSITTIKKADLENFLGLKRVSINENNLTEESKKELNDYIVAHPRVKVEFRFNNGEEGSDADVMELFRNNHMHLP